MCREPHRRNPIALRVPRAVVVCLAVLLVAALGCRSTGVSRIGAAPEQGGNDPFRPLLGSGTTAEMVQPDDQVTRKTGTPHSYTIRYTRWEPDQANANGLTIVYNHGFQSHRGWFNATGAELARRGFTVYAFDRIGSGESTGGFAREGHAVAELPGHIRSWRLFLDTLDRMLAIARGEHPDHPIVLWGNSYGAKIVAAYLVDRAPDLERAGISAAVFTTPGLYPNNETMPLPFSKLKLLASGPLTMFPVPMVERDGDNGASWFVAPGEWFDRIRADRRSLREVTRTFYLQTAKLDRFWSRGKGSVTVDLPSFFLLVRGDELMDNDKVERFAARRMTDAIVKYYRGGPEGKHFLLFTADREAALADIERFCLGRADELEGVTR